VRNGDRWTVTDIRDDGSLTARRADGRGTVILPPTTSPITSIWVTQ
jgi:hypothetical protein